MLMVSRGCAENTSFFGGAVFFGDRCRKEVCFICLLDPLNIPKITFSVGIWMSRGMDAVLQSTVMHFNSETNTLLSLFWFQMKYFWW